MSVNANRIDSSFLQEVAGLRSATIEVQAIPQVVIDQSQAKGQESIVITIPTGVQTIQIVDIPAEALFFELSDGSADVNIVIKNCHNLKYVQLSDDGSYHVSIVSDKEIGKIKNGSSEIVTSTKDNPLPNMLFVNGVMKEFFVMWGAAKKQEARKDINNAVTRESKLLPEEFTTEEAWVAGGGIWKYDVFDTFMVEPNIVYAADNIDSAFIGSSLGLFDFDSNYVDAVVVDGSNIKRSNPATRRNSNTPRKQASPVPVSWDVGFKVMYINHKDELSACTEITCEKTNQILCVYNAENLTRIIGNNQKDSKIDVGSCPKLKEIKNCSIDYVGLNDMSITGKNSEISLDGHITKFYAERVSVNIVKCKSIQDYFIIGTENADDPVSDIIAFEFTENAPNRSKTRSNPAKSSVTSNVSGYQSAKEKIQSLFLNTKNSSAGFAIPPQGIDSVFYLIENFYDEVYLKLVKDQGVEQESFLDIITPYIRGAGEAVNGSESKHAILFLQILITQMFFPQQNQNLQIDGSQVQGFVDMIWESRMKSLAYATGKYSIDSDGVIKQNVDDCDSWVWNFERMPTPQKGSLDQDESISEYIVTWLCDIALYVYARLFGSNKTQTSAITWARKAIPQAYAPIQLYTIQSIVGSNEARAIFLYGLIKFARTNKNENIIEAMNNELLALSDMMIHAMGNLPFDYTGIKLTLVTDGFTSQVKEYITQKDDQKVDMFSKASSYSLMTTRGPLGDVVGFRYDYRFNAYMLHRFIEVLFLGNPSYGKTRTKNNAIYWSSLFQGEEDLREMITKALVYSYMMNLPTDQNLMQVESFLTAEDPFQTLTEDRYQSSTRLTSQGLTSRDIESIKNAVGSMANMSNSSNISQQGYFRAIQR